MKLDKSLLVRIFGPKAAFFHGDTLILDRWKFVKRHLPETRNGERVFDAGCGSGAFTINLARRGYRGVGLSWDERNQAAASERAAICGVADATSFPIGDLRKLGELSEHVGRYDYVLSLESIEHVLDDRKLVRDLAACLRPGGWLVLTTPNKDYRAITPGDDGPFSTQEDGWHVRRGYTGEMLRELALGAGLRVEEIGGCSGFFSQKLTEVMRRFGWLGWAATAPLRIVPILLDGITQRITGYPDYSITMVAYRPRFEPLPLSQSEPT